MRRITDARPCARSTYIPHHIELNWNSKSVDKENEFHLIKTMNDMTGIELMTPSITAILYSYNAIYKSTTSLRIYASSLPNNYANAYPKSAVPAYRTH